MSRKWSFSLTKTDTNFWEILVHVGVCRMVLPLDSYDAQSLTEESGVHMLRSVLWFLWASNYCPFVVAFTVEMCRSMTVKDKLISRIDNLKWFTPSHHSTMSSPTISTLLSRYCQTMGTIDGLIHISIEMIQNWITIERIESCESFEQSLMWFHRRHVYYDSRASGEIEYRWWWALWYMRITLIKFWKLTQNGGE